MFERQTCSFETGSILRSLLHCSHSCCSPASWPRESGSSSSRLPLHASFLSDDKRPMDCGRARSSFPETLRSSRACSTADNSLIS